MPSVLSVEYVENAKCKMERGKRVQRIRIRLSKLGMLRYISHRDLMRLVERAARRASLPLALTAGFKPHPKMSFGRALPVGETSRSIQVDLFLAEHLKPELLLEKLNKKLPEEVQVLEANEIGLENIPPD